MTLITYCGEVVASRRRKSAIGGVGSVDVLKHDLLFFYAAPTGHSQKYRKTEMKIGLTNFYPKFDYSKKI